MKWMRVILTSSFLFLLYSQGLSQPAPSSMEIYQPHHVPAKVLVDGLAPMYRDESIRIHLVEPLNQIMVEGTPDRLPPVMELLEKLDRPRAQATCLIEIIQVQKGSLRPQVPRELLYLKEQLEDLKGYSTFESLNQLKSDTLEGSTSKMQIMPGRYLEFQVVKVEPEEKTAEISYDVFEESGGVLHSLLRNTTRLKLNQPTVQGGARLTGHLDDKFLFVGLSLTDLE